MSARGARTAACAAAGLGLAACAGTPPPPPPAAVLDIAAKRCGNAYDTGLAAPVAPEKYRRQHDVAAALDGASPCVALPDGQNANYAVFALPPASRHHLFTAGAMPEAVRSVAPAVLTLRADGTVSRRFAGEDLIQRGAMLSAQFRARADEAYLVIRSDPDRVGQTRSAVETGVVTGSTYVYTPTGGGTAYTSSGYDREVARTFSHEGRVLVRMQDTTPKAERRKD